MKYFTSDLHFNHKNICRGVSEWGEDANTRDFDNLSDMNDAILHSINSKVGKDDELYILGDFAMGPKAQHHGFRERIVCSNISLICGNHDHPNDPSWGHGFDNILDYMEVSVKAKDGRKNKIVCFHYYIGGVWNNVGRGWFHLFGHSHGSLDKSAIRGKAFDIGWDVWKEPLSEEEIFQEMDKLDETTDFIDHHTKTKSSWSY